jgi:HlyD family secretion protein
MKWLKRIAIWALILAVVGGLIWGGTRLLRERTATTDDPNSLTQVVAAQRGDLTASISPTGEVYAPRRADLSFDVTRLPLTELNVTAGQPVSEGDVLARIDPASLERAVQQAEADLLSAEDALETAKNPYTKLDQQLAELTVAQAQTAMEEARENLADLQDPDLETARDAVQSAGLELRQAREDLATLKADKSIQEEIDLLQWEANEALALHGDLVKKGDPGDIAQDRLVLAYNKMMDAKEAVETAKAQAALDLLVAENTVTEAQDTLDDAKAELADLQAGPTALEVAQAKDAVAQAEYDLAKAKDDLAEIEAGADPNEVQVAQASYDAAVAALEEAQATLDAATMVAPFDGTVISVGAEVGDLVSSGTAIVTLADLSQLRALATIDETDISQVEVGQQVQITFDAFPGREFQGKVLEVPLQGTLSDNVVTYEVPVSLEGTEGVALKSGMTANLTIIVGQRENVLLVPALAVQQGDAGDVVLVQDAPGTEAVQVPVEVGLSDGTYVEVLRGLNEGDQVVVQYEAAEQTDGFFFGRFEGRGAGGADFVVPAGPGGPGAPPGEP